MSEWIRPKGCEGGACVEYRTVDGKVFVRNGGTENLSDDGNMLVFTVAEWDTFVAGLVALVAAERDAVAADHKSTFGAARAVVDARDAEIARLEKSLTDSACEVETLKAQLDQATARLSSARGRYAADIVRLWRERNEAIAEAAVLRRRDRRTQAVVDAAKEWFEHEPPFGGSPQDGVLFNAVASYLGAWETGLSATESAEKPPVEDTATDGLEAQGGAQDATTCRCGAPDSLHEEGDIRIIPAAPTAADLQAARDQTRADAEEMLRRVDFDTSPERGATVVDFVAVEEAQDRTEGLDAAIEAAAATGQHYESEPETDDDESYCICGDPWVERHAAEVFVRAASPLIERAALHAAADAVAACKRCGKEHFLRRDEDNPHLYGTWADPGDGHPYERTGPESAVGWLRDRATRTETS